MFAGLSWALPTRPRPAIPDGLLDYAASELAAMIDDARRQAIAGGVGPVPVPIHRALLGFFPAALMQRCRFATGGGRKLSLPALGFAYGDATAITLGEVVLFKTGRDAESDLKRWARELTHVMQYQRWGIEGFAQRYVRDSQSVEQEAADNADRFAAWLPRRGHDPGGSGE